MEIENCAGGLPKVPVIPTPYCDCTFVSIDSWDETAHPKECNTMYILSDGSGAYYWDGAQWRFIAFGGGSGSFVTEQEFNSYRTQQQEVDEEQDSRLDYLETETLELNTKIYNLSTDISTLNTKIQALEDKLEPLYQVFTDVWNNAAGTELEVPGTKLSFVFIKNANGTYLPYLRNLGTEDITIWYRTTQEYDISGIVEYSQNIAMAIPAGGTSDKLDNDSYGLGYGNYPNFLTLKITINETGEFYIWEAQTNSRTNAANTGTLSTVIRRYF